MIELNDIFNLQNFLLSIIIISLILIIRYIFLRITNRELLPLVFIFPKGK
jgi:hypothetical protein